MSQWSSCVYALVTGEQLARQQELDNNKLENQRLSQEIATLKQELLLFGMSVYNCGVILSLYYSNFLLFAQFPNW